MSFVLDTEKIKKMTEHHAKLCKIMNKIHISLKAEPENKENDENPMPRWKEFVFDQRCNNGLELHNISEDEYTELRNKYDQLLDQSYNNRGH